MGSFSSGGAKPGQDSSSETGGVKPGSRKSKSCSADYRHIFLRQTLWCQLEDIFQLIVTPQGIEKVTIQLIDTPTKVYAIGARLFLSKVPLEVLQNWVLIQLIVTPHILGKVQGQIKEVCR